MRIDERPLKALLFGFLSFFLQVAQQESDNVLDQMLLQSGHSI